MPGTMEFEFSLKPKPKQARDQATPMRILLMGEFSGRNSTQDALAQRRIHAVDIDSFDSVLQRLQPQLQLANGEPLIFNDIDDFHPDHLYMQLGLFKSLRQLRQKLLNPDTAAEALADLQHEGDTQPATQQTATQNPSSGNMFADLLGAPAGSGAASNPAQTSMDQFIQTIVGPHIVTAHDTQQYVDGIDSAISEQMRALLHHHDFQSLEAAWRGLAWLISMLETGEELKLYLLDVSKAELAADIKANGDALHNSALYQRLVEQGLGTVGGEAWSSLIGLYDFAATESDLSLLAALGTLASHAGGPFLAAADPSLIGCASSLDIGDPNDWTVDGEFAKQWQNLRESAVAPWLGLVLPRVLLRLPYGAKTEAVDRFDFEEQSAAREHDAYLWGNPALACGLLLGRSFLAQSWSMSPGDDLDVDDLPAHSFKEDGESKMQACAEIFLSERQADSISAQGIMALMSYRNHNQARLLAFRSVASPASNLAGAWR